MTTLEETIRDNAIWYQTNTKSQVSANDMKFNDRHLEWYSLIHKHYQNSLLSQLKNQDERFIEYWPTLFMWGTSSASKISGSEYINTVEHKYGNFGTGYLCLSDKNLYIVVFAQLTKKFPLIRKDAVGWFFNVMTDISDERNPIKEDKVRAINYSSVDAAEITDDNELKWERIYLRTSAGVYYIYSHFNNCKEEILAAIKMGVSGKLASIWSSNSNDNKTSLVDVPELLKKLKELRDNDIINEEEFQEKKRKLLSKI